MSFWDLIDRHPIASSFAFLVFLIIVHDMVVAFRSGK